MNSEDRPDVAGLLSRTGRFFNDFLHTEIIPRIRRVVVAPLAEPMIYSLDAPGKRLRPVLCLWAAGIESESAGNKNKDDAATRAALFAATALECIHTYSLIHDDLPAMDDDDLRRGRPSCHKKYSEWAAILAGDALNTFAFELLGDAAREGAQPQIVPDLLRVLSEGAGRMVCGQALDLDSERGDSAQPALTREPAELLGEIHRKKTAALIRSSVELGAILSGANESGRAACRSYGENLGLLFQIADDLLDVEGESHELGKTAGKDAAAGKLTYPALFGLDGSRQRARQLHDTLREQANRLPVQSPVLVAAFRALPEFVLNRRS